MSPEGSNAAELHRRVRDVFLRARELRGPERQRYLDEACADSEAVRAEVESLLGFDESSVSPLDEPVLGSRTPASEGLVLDEGESQAGRRIGGYEVLSELGRGGMGVVYLAEQELTHRRVAIKVLNTRSYSPGRLRRFELEAQILGLLKHPGIAQIYEAGTADLGAGSQMFFAMELVEGPPLTEFARERKLPPAERIGLLVRVCEAVHHAHLRGVIHRDLKPDNILVDELGACKVLDFGVALFDEGEAGEARARQAGGGLVGTPAYMSPEQRAGRSELLDARSDVYTLGVIAHELLQGQLPGRGAPASASIDEELRAILDTALAPEPDDRYSTAAALAEDLRRYLAHEPLHVRKATAGYVLRKFAQRRRSLATALVGIILLLIAGVVVSTSFGFEARRQTERKEKLIDFLREVLTSPIPMRSGSDVTLLEVLAESEAILQRSLVDEPEVEADVRLILGELYRSLGDTLKAEPHLRLSLELSRQVRGEDHLQTRLAKLELARVLVLYLGKIDEAEALVRDLLAAGPGSSSKEGELYFTALASLAGIQRKHGHQELAVQTYLEAEQVLSSLEGMPPVTRIRVRSNRARILTELQRFDEAEAIARAALDSALLQLEDGHRETLGVKMTIGFLLLQIAKAGDPSRLVEAETMARDILAGRTARLGVGHPGTLSGLRLLSEVLDLQGRIEEAIEVQRSAYDAYYTGPLGVDRRDAKDALEYLEELLRRAGREAEALELRAEHERAIARGAEQS